MRWKGNGGARLTSAPPAPPSPYVHASSPSSAPSSPPLIISPFSQARPRYHHHRPFPPPPASASSSFLLLRRRLGIDEREHRFNSVRHLLVLLVLLFSRESWSSTLRIASAFLPGATPSGRTRGVLPPADAAPHRTWAWACLQKPLVR
jgi:hypothetical protein